MGNTILESDYSQSYERNETKKKKKKKKGEDD